MTYEEFIDTYDIFRGDSVIDISELAGTKPVADIPVFTVKESIEDYDGWVSLAIEADQDGNLYLSHLLDYDDIFELRLICTASQETIDRARIKSLSFYQASDLPARIFIATYVNHTGEMLIIREFEMLGFNDD